MKYALVIIVCVCFTYSQLNAQDFLNEISAMRGCVKTLKQVDSYPSKRGIVTKTSDSDTFSYAYCEYDKLSRIREYGFSLGSLYCSYHNVYDSIGRLAKTIAYDSTQILYSYDSSNNLIKREVISTPGNLTSSTYRYNVDNLLLAKSFFEDTSLIIVEYYLYNKANQLKTIISISDHDTITIVRYIYDKNERIISKITNFTSEPKVEIEKYQYNRKGDVVLHIYQKNGEVGSSDNYSFKYNYDKSGNWKLRKVYKNNELAYITQRKIMYY